MKKFKARKTREQKLIEDVAFLNKRVNDIEEEKKTEVNLIFMKGMKEVGYQKKLLLEMEEDRDHWKHQAQVLQATIDASENINNTRKMLGLKNAIKYIIDFKLPA